MEIDGLQIPTLAETDKRFSLLLWGLAGCGKTALAMSLPGRKLLINFDPDGPNTLGARDDIILIDLSGEKFTVVDKFKDDDPILPLAGKTFRLSKIIEDLSIDSIVVDSCTAYSQLAVEKGINVTNGATLERPSPGAYGARNAITLRMMSNILRITKRLNKHIAFITHEDDGGVKDKEGNILHITMLLGGKLGQQVALQISEVWYMQDDGKARKILVRPGRMRKPMKTRMVLADKEIEFVLLYNLNKPFEQGLAEFIELWEANGRDKIPIPYSADYQKLKQKLLKN